MKTKTFLLLCLFLCIATTQLSAQNGKNGTGTSVFTIDQGYWSPVYCTNEQGVLTLVDILEGTLTSKIEVHYKNNQYQWYMLEWKGELTGLNQEVFQIHESDKIDIPNPGDWSYHFNLVGNKGSHYINSGTLNTVDWTVTVNKSVCLGN
jgi:hypothetical protein